MYRFEFWVTDGNGVPLYIKHMIVAEFLSTAINKLQSALGMPLNEGGYMIKVIEEVTPL